MVTTMAELNNAQQAVCYQALYNVLGPVVKANGDGLRGDVDREMRGIYELTGAKTFKIRADGVELGTYSVTESAAVPEHDEVDYDLCDEDLLREWLAGDGSDMALDFIIEHGVAFCEWCAADGIIPDGIAPRVTRVPAKPASYKGGQIRVDKGFQEQVKMRMNTGLAALVAPASALLPEG